MAEMSSERAEGGIARTPQAISNAHPGKPHFESHAGTIYLDDNRSQVVGTVQKHAWTREGWKRRVL
eukprot:5878470-Pyramimonas_sp.AAC.1